LDKHVPGGGIDCNSADVAEIYPIGMVYDDLKPTVAVFSYADRVS